MNSKLVLIKSTNHIENVNKILKIFNKANNMDNYVHIEKRGIYKM